MKLSLEQLSARMRQGETIPSRQTAQVALALSIPSILEQLVVTAMGYIDAAMVGHIGAEATASIGIVSSSTWLLHGVLVGLYTALSIQIAQYLGADRQDDARSVLRQAMLFNVILGVGAALFGLGISPFLPGWLGADPSLRANSTAYFAIWSAALPFTMAMGLYLSILRAAGNALTASLISVLVCVLDAIFNFFLINPTRTLWGITVWGAGLGVPGAALGTALATVVGGLLALAILLLRDGPLCIRKPAPWKITRSCLRNLLWVGVPLAGERAAISLAQVVLVRIVAGLGTVAIAANSLPGCQRRGPVLHGRLRHPERSCHPHRPGRGCQPEGYGQAVCLAVHRPWHGGHGPFRRWSVDLCPHPDEPFHHRCGCHRSGCSGFAHRSLGRAHVRRFHRGQRCHAGCGRQHLLFCAEHIQHVVHPADAGVPAGSPAGPDGRLGCHVLRTEHPGPAVPYPPCPGQVAGKGRAVLNRIDKSKKERTLSRPFFFITHFRPCRMGESGL